MNKIIVLALLLISPFLVAAQSKIGIFIDNNEQLIPPDEILYAKAFKNYKAGYDDYALKYLKESASYGNNNAKYLIALIHIQQEDWVSASAWLSLLEEAPQELSILLTEIDLILDNSQQREAKILTQQLRFQYNSKKALMNRDRWVLSHSMIKNRIGKEKIINPNSTYVSANAKTILGKNLQILLDEYAFDYSARLREVDLSSIVQLKK